MLGCNSITELNKPSSCVGSLGCVCVCVHSGGFVVQTRCAHTRTMARGIRLSFGFPSFWSQEILEILVDSGFCGSL